jgi:hypothetical protein
MRLRGLMATVVILATTVAGCASDDASDQVGWAQQAEGICRDATREASKLPQDLGLKPDAPGRAREREILDDKLARLRELDVPADVTDDFQRMIKLSTQSAAVHERFLRAASNPTNPQARAQSIRLLQAQRRLGKDGAKLARELDLANCAGAGSDDGGAEAEKTVGAAGYELTLADGWRGAESRARGELRLRAGRNGLGEAAMTISRLPDPPPNISLERLTEFIRQRVLSNVSNLSAPDVEPTRPVSLGGEPARTYELNVRLHGRQARMKGLVTIRDGAAYTVVFAGPVGSAARERDYRAMLKSWRWKQQEGRPRRMDQSQRHVPIRDTVNDPPLPAVASSRGSARRSSRTVGLCTTRRSGSRAADERQVSL